MVSCHPRGEDATLLLPLHASCLLLPALEFACAHGEPIQGAHPSEIPGYPTAHCPPSCPNQPSVGCRGQVAGAAPLEHETAARTVGNLSTISNHLPTCGSTGESRPKKRKADLSKLRGSSEVDADSFSRDHQRAGRALKELQGEERKKGPNHSMQRRETQLGCSLLAGPHHRYLPKGEITPEGIDSPMLIYILGLLKPKYAWCFRNDHL